jgi:integrase
MPMKDLEVLGLAPGYPKARRRFGRNVPFGQRWVIAENVQTKGHERLSCLNSKTTEAGACEPEGQIRSTRPELVTLGVRSGLRISELLSLKIGQVWAGKQVVPRLYLRRSAAKGKRAGASIVIHPEAAKAMNRWIKRRGGNCNPTDYLFSSRKNHGHSLTRTSAWRILHGVFLAAGVPGMAGTHCLRKTFARNVHESLHGDLFRLSKAMRHASPMTTLAYLSFQQEEIDGAILAT